MLGFIDRATPAGVRRSIVKGGYTREGPAPRDVALMIVHGSDYPKDQDSAADEELAVDDTLCHKRGASLAFG